MFPDFKPYHMQQGYGVGWLRSVPAHWNIVRLRHLVTCLDGKRVPLAAAERGKILGPYPYWGANRIIDYVNDYLFDEELVLLGEDGAPFLERDKPVAFFSQGKVWPNNHIHVLRPKGSAQPEFLAYALNCVDYARYIGGATRDKLTQSQMKALPIPVPFATEQRAIVRFLNHADLRIQRYIRAKEKLIGLLEEQRQAIIHQAVTGRINVETGQPYPAYKDSGVEWLERVPEHWTVRRNKWLFTERNETGFGFLPVLSVSLHQGVCVRDIEAGGRKRQMAERDRYQRARRGDIAYNMMRMWQGAVGVVPADGLVSPAYVVMSPVDDVRSPYYGYLFRIDAYKQVVKRSSRGIVSDRDRLYWEAFNRIASIVPPTGEQAGIARFLERADRRTSARRATAQRQIELLREYRTRLITDVVTGKLDVREAAANLPDADATASMNPGGADHAEPHAYATARDIAREAIP